MNKIFKVPQLPWDNPRALELSIPDSWQVEVCNMAGYDRPAMNSNQIKASVTNLIGSPPIRELAKGKKEVVIVFDDLARVTRFANIVPFVLDELNQAGIPDRRIRFIAALGNHSPMDRLDFIKKLGEVTLSRCAVYNHNTFDNFAYAGTTSYGTKLFINAEVMNCDFKISLAGVLPHPMAVFGGGGKMIVPGVSSKETTKYNHSLIVEPADYDTQKPRLDMEEAAKIVGLDIAIECIVNLWGDTVAIYAGAETPAHEAAVKDARRSYLCPKAENKDIVIANAYIKVSESILGIRTAASLSQKGGSLVIIANSPEGQIVHYGGGIWGHAPRDKGDINLNIPSNIKHIIFYTEYPDMAGMGWFGDDTSGRFMQRNNWDEVINTLQRMHGDSARVALYPNGDIGHFE